jgi:hypothetical protein
VKVIAALEELLAALSRGDASEGLRLTQAAAPIFASGASELSRDELFRAMQLQGRCTVKAQELRATMLAELDSLSLSRRASALYRVRR